MTWCRRILSVCLCGAASAALAGELTSPSFRVPAVSMSGGGAVNMRSESAAEMIRQVAATIGQPAPVGPLQDGAGNVACVGGFWAAESAASPPPTCPGDCSGDGAVTVNELVQGVNIALGNVSPQQCPMFDSNADNAVTVNELIQGVNNALNGCPER